MFEEHALAVTAALFCVSLPMAFAGAKGAAVLDVTRRMREDCDRRVNETGRFLFDVLTPDAFGPKGRGIRSAQKVRLMHASVRRVAGRQGADAPINQQDLVGTLVCFSVVVLDALARMGISVRRSEAEDYIHLWRVVGHMLGILPEFLPRDLSAMRAAGEHIREVELRPSRHGRELARVLLNGMERHLPARGFGVVAPSLMRFLLGDGIGDLLALPRTLSAADGDAVARFLRRAKPPSGREPLRRSTAALLEQVVALKLGGAPPTYGAPLVLESRGCPFHRSRNTQEASR